MHLLEEHFFLQIHNCDGLGHAQARCLDEGIYLLVIADKPLDDSLRSKIDTIEPTDRDDLDLGHLLPELYNEGSLHETRHIIALLNRPTGQFQHINTGLPPLLIKTSTGGFKRIFPLESRNKDASYTIHVHPLNEIGTLLMGSTRLDVSLLEKRYLSFFSSKEILSAIRDFSEHQQLTEDFCFIFLNNEIHRHLKFIRHESIAANLDAIKDYEEKLETILADSFTDNHELNSNTVLIFNELILNAFEHGVLGIDANKKQQLMESGAYENYIEDVQEQVHEKLQVTLSFYDNHLQKITIKDNGSGFDFESLMESEPLVEEGFFQGRGLIMARTLSSALFYRNSGNEVVFFMHDPNLQDFPLQNAELSDEQLLSRTVILFVEDDKFIRTHFAYMLKRSAKTLLVADNGREGLELFKQYRPDIVITDVEMPEMDGLEMATAIKEIDQDTPIIVTTAYNNESFFIRAIDAGVDKFIIKPINVIKLKKVLYQYARMTYLKNEAKQNLQLEQQRKEQMLTDLKAKNSYHQSQQQAAFQKQQMVILDQSRLLETYLKSSVYYRPLEILSGDIYGIMQSGPKQVFAYIIDSMGKGLPASVTAILSAGFLNRAATLGTENHNFRFEQILDDYINYIRSYLLDDECVSIAFVSLDLNTNQLTYASYGMYPLLLIDLASGNLQELPSNNPPFMRYFHQQEIAQGISLPEHFRLLIYSDGLVEREQFDYKGFSQVALESKTTQSVIEMVTLSEKESLDDDLTLIALER